MKMRAELKNDSLVLSTGVLEYACSWNEGHLIGLYLEHRDGVRWDLNGNSPDCEFPGQVAPPTGGKLEITKQAATAISPAHLRVEVFTRLDTLEIKRVFKLFQDCPMIGCRIELRGSAKGPWRKTRTDVSTQVNIESEELAYGQAAGVATLHRMMVPHHHLDVECAQFFDVTDYRNNLVQSLNMEPYIHPVPLRGNVLIARDRLNDRGLVLLKEAPCSDVQLASPGFDFLSCMNQIQIVGIGLEPEDVTHEWTTAYGFAFGAAERDTFALLSALHDYQHRLRAHDSRRDDMIMLNTWGDRGEARDMCEAWVMKEIEAGARLGVTHFQLDHGWETTQNQDVVWPPNFKRIWDTPWFWDVNPKRFPNGLGPCVDAAKRVGIELCLWFGTATEDSYAHWQDDANAIIKLYRQYGIRTFKIDFVQVPDKLAERNLRRMLETILEATGQQAVFNLDVTAGRRFGYFDFTEYGNKFLENRYTDWSNYYPHWALRNLWMLSRYVPSRTLQVEFLNKWRNPEKYSADDPLAPSKVPFDYAFAVTMAAQPLAWFEANNLPPEAFDIAPLLSIYKEHQAAFHAVTILPIGETPNGTGWTGFQSCYGKTGYFLVFREWNQRKEAAMTCWTKPGQRVHCRCLAGHGKDFNAEADTEGRVTFQLPKPFSFAFYRYDDLPN